MEPDAFLADDRPGLMVGALRRRLRGPRRAARAVLDPAARPRRLHRRGHLAGPVRRPRVDRPQRPAGADARQLGAGRQGRPGELARKVVDAVVNAGWGDLDGDLVIADEANPAFVAASRSLAPHQEVRRRSPTPSGSCSSSPLLLLLLALQVVIAIRRDRQLSRERDDELGDEARPTSRTRATRSTSSVTSTTSTSRSTPTSPRSAATTTRSPRGRREQIEAQRRRGRGRRRVDGAGTTR